MGEQNSRAVTVFRGRVLPEPGTPAGYAHLIETFGLEVPLPQRLAAIAERHHPRPTEDWLLLTPKHAPASTLRSQLEFALKYEGVDLLVLEALFRSVDAAAVRDAVLEAPKGRHTRRIWFLFEWLTGTQLDLPDLGKISTVPVLDPDLQIALKGGDVSRRHKVVNNLPGTPAFCPLVRWTPRLRELTHRDLPARAREVIGRTHPDVLSRAAAFLLLDDSRASFGIEGEQPSHDRATRWANAIAEAGQVPLSIGELERLQRVVIGDARLVPLGLRRDEGFIGTHDRISGAPLPVHVSARHKDLEHLIEGLCAFDARTQGALEPLAAATSLAFGFVFIHPFMDGNGRIHRWLIHHVLAKSGFSPAGVVFPVSAAILRNLDAYKRVLETYSKPVFQYVRWEPTETGNVRVLNETAPLYRFFDATPQAEFLYACVEETIEKDLPQEVSFLERFDQFAREATRIIDMPARTIELLHGFLRQNNGQFSNRARTREFEMLSDVEVARLEALYKSLWPVSG